MSSSSSSDTHFGLTGLATMGANLARNVAHHDIPIAVHNRTTSRMQTFIDEHGSEGPISGHESTEEWVGALARPRVLMSLVQAGAATDAVIDEIAPHLDQGDILIDGGNANFRDTQRRHAKLAEQGIHFLGVGVSGGEEGALNGPSIMPGGDREPYDESVKPIFEAIAAQVDGTPCCTYVGPDGAGHYVKMVHNGIEYADMQLIAESYDLLRHGVGLEVPEIAERFRAWNESELESFLIEISARVLAKTDEATGQPLVDVILDAAEQKGTGRWTAQNALELGVPLTGITEAVFARALSALKEQRVHAAERARRARAPTDVRRRRVSWPTTSSTRCTRRRSSPTRRASPRWRPPPTTRAGRSTSARWRRSGAAAASSAPASWTASARPTTTSRAGQPDARRLLRQRAAGGPGPVAARRRPRRRARASRRRRSPRRWPTTTATGAPGGRPA